jgi:hypothetical protein
MKICKIYKATKNGPYKIVAQKIYIFRSVERGDEEKEKLKAENDAEDEQDPYAWLSRTAPPSPG